MTAHPPGTLVASTWNVGSIMYDVNDDVLIDTTFFTGVVLASSRSHGHLMLLVLPTGRDRVYSVFADTVQRV